MHIRPVSSMHGSREVRTHLSRHPHNDLHVILSVHLFNPLHRLSGSWVHTYTYVCQKSGRVSSPSHADSFIDSVDMYFSINLSDPQKIGKILGISLTKSTEVSIPMGKRVLDLASSGHMRGGNAPVWGA